MPAPHTVYLILSGAATAFRAVEIVAGLRSHFDHIITIQTPNSKQLISPLELVRVPGNRVVDSYLDPSLQPRAPAAQVVFAPCSFNSLNKLAQGIADNLALSIAAEMIGLHQRVLVALSFNEGLWAHPATSTSIATLRNWGVHVIEPQDTGQGFMMAPVDTIIAASIAGN